MQAIVAALAAQQAETSALVSDLDIERWEAPTPREGWTVRDVIVHLAQTNEMATASAHGRFGAVMAELTAGLGPAADVDEGAAMMVARDRGRPPDEIRRRWQASADTLDAALLACDPSGRVDWVAGPLSARTLATTRLAETWIHTGDVAAALTRQLPATDRLWHIARLAWRTLPYAFARAGRTLSGPVALDLRGPDDQAWAFQPETRAVTTVAGNAIDLCLVAGRRLDPRHTTLRGDGPDADAVLELIRTYA